MAKTTKQKIGLVLFWIGVVYLIIVSGGGGWGSPSIVQRVTEFLDMGKLPFLLWGYSVPIGILLSGIGMLLYANVKRSRIWLYGIGIGLTVLVVDFFLRMYLVETDWHYPPLFGIGGVLILIFFILILWYWAKKRINLEGSAKTAADLQLTGYTFFFITSWYLCDTLGIRLSGAPSDFLPRSPINIIIYLVLGFLFLFLSHYKSSKSN